MSGCPLCRKPFAVGDELILIVTQLLEGDKLEYIPAHRSCKQAAERREPGTTK